jgi:hypothetical protein
VTLAELEAVCREACRDLVARGRRPLPATVVLPLPQSTRVVELEDFPDDDPARFDLVAAFVEQVMRPAGAPAYGFVAEATLADDVDVAVVVYGARRRGQRVTVAPFEDGVLGDFSDAEEADPAAFPFLSPLQHAADHADPPEQGGLPIIT